MKKIMIVDDEKDFAFFIKQSLEITGKYAAVVVTSGRDAVPAALRENPDLIFLDIIMPDMSGFDVLKKLKESGETSHIPVVILTAVGTETAKDRAKGLYDEDYMVKPVQVSALIEKIDDMLARGSRQAKKEPR